MSPDERYVVVGVTRDQPIQVMEHAARFARCFGAVLVCAQVNPAYRTITQEADGSVRAEPIDPDAPDDPLQLDPAIELQGARAARVENVPMQTRVLAGDPAQALAGLADALDADMLIVGSRHAGFKGTMHDFFGGSVAVHLAHHQHRPVVVIPVSPSEPGTSPRTAT